MYSTYDGAKRRAQTVAAVLQGAELPTPLHVCQRALALAGGYRDWDHLRRTLAKGVSRQAQLDGFLRRLVFALPDQAVGPAYRWAETVLSDLEDRMRGKPTSDRETLDWYTRVYEFVSAIGVIHRSRTPLLTPGSGAGQRLRQDMVLGLCIGPAKPRFDPESYVLTFEGSLEELMPEDVGHRNFGREFERLCAAGIFEWNGEAQILRLNPPPVDQVRAHIAKCRGFDAEYWREAA
ncbi:hypothetical protein [Phenylobacterium sp.]|uniref:hypothetical protein n=1 Tax=Phenylobacterium sp. TaxID=1871053 RepID=UPI00272FA30B|nr:hypothetical protein [Phenylobacterium sp.]MDP1598730.1 hypothetical protein [Phenylobacterium sp.]